jgi:tetratricopeptide (TPR) repeat protein
MLLPAVGELIAHRPLMGYGLDSFSYVFSPYFPRGMGETESFMHMPDRAHNIVLDSLVEKGAMGVLWELCFFVLLCVVLKKRWKKADENQRALLLLSLSVLLFQYISFLGGFPTISDTVLRWLFLALFFSQIPEDGTGGEKKGVLPVLGMSVMVIPFVLYGAVSTYRSDVLYARAIASSSQSLYIEALKNAPAPYEYLIFGSDILRDIHDKITFLKNAEKLNPQDYFLHIQLLRAYALLKEQEPMHAALSRAEELCPNCPLVYVYGGEALERMGEKERAHSLFQKYVDLAPSYVQSYLRGQEAILRDYEKERLRIFLKENEEYFSYVVKTLGLKQNERKM